MGSYAGTCYHLRWIPFVQPTAACHEVPCLSSSIIISFITTYVLDRSDFGAWYLWNASAMARGSCSITLDYAWHTHHFVCHFWLPTNGEKCVFIISVQRHRCLLRELIPGRSNACDVNHRPLCSSHSFRRYNKLIAVLRATYTLISRVLWFLFGF